MKGGLISVNIQRWRYVVTDLITTAIAFFIFNQIRYLFLQLYSEGITLSEYLSEPKMIGEQILIPLSLLGIYWLSGYYNNPFGRSRLQEFYTTLFTGFLNAIIIYLALMINDQLPSRALSYELLIALAACMFICVYVGRIILTQSAIKKFENREWSFNTVIIGTSEDAIKTAHRLEHSQTKLGYHIIGHIPIPGEVNSKQKHHTLTERQFESLCTKNKIDQLIIVPEKGSHEEKTLRLLYKFFPAGVPIKIAPTSLSFLTSNIQIEDIYAEPFIDMTSPSIRNSQKNMKRVIDVMASSLALLIGSPILLGIALAVKFGSKGPIIYSQERIGYRQKPFKIYKFRSMHTEAESNGPQLSDDDDPRITPIGKVLRKYRLDELPQFWNVLKGDMSLVGPRPERAFFIDQIVAEAPYYTLMHQVKPGITSWGMVKFGYAKTVAEMVERTRYDLIYLNNMSLAVDFKIMIHTVKTVVLGEGV